MDYNEDADDSDHDDNDAELPGVEINKEEGEQLWKDLNQNEVPDLMDEVADPVQPEPQHDDEDIEDQQEVATVPVD